MDLSGKERDGKISGRLLSSEKHLGSGRGNGKKRQMHILQRWAWGRMGRMEAKMYPGFKISLSTRQLAHWFRAIPTLPEDLSSGPSTHT